MSHVQEKPVIWVWLYCIVYCKQIGIAGTHLSLPIAPLKTQCHESGGCHLGNNAYVLCSSQFPRNFKCVMAHLVYFTTIIVISSFISSSESTCTSQFWDKNIIVSHNGRDHEGCLSGNTGVPCATLGYVLRELQNKNKLDHTLINVDYDHDLASPLYISGVCDLAIVGGNDPILNCSRGSGIAVSNSINILVEGVAWEGCSISHYTTSLDSTSATLNATSSIVFYCCINVTISNCRLTSEWGAGVSIC